MSVNSFSIIPDDEFLVIKDEEMENIVVINDVFDWRDNWKKIPAVPFRDNIRLGIGSKN